VDSLTLGLAATVILGVGCQWLAERFALPSILLLLVAGVLAGPVTGIIEPDELFGPLLFPSVSLAVAVLLFEGGLGLRVGKLAAGRGPVIRLVTVGVLLTWLVAFATIWALLGFDPRLAALAGAILVVSGPTVIGPVLRLARPREPTASILRWEGIFVDPVGAVLAVVVFSAVYEGESSVVGGAVQVAVTALGGGAVGLLAALGLVWALQHHLVVDRLHNAVTLMTVFAAYTGANAVSPDAGLFAATVAGVVLANQDRAPIAHIAEFEENLGTLILAGLFVVLGARIDLARVGDIALPTLGVILVLVVVARPLAVWASTIGSGLGGRDRAYLALLAPRGIVAAAVSSLFAIELDEMGEPAGDLVPLTFTVIFVTVALYGLLGRPLARWLRVGSPLPGGVAMVGGSPWILDLAERLVDDDVPVLIVSKDAAEVAEASRRGLLVYDGELDGDGFAEALESVGIGQALVLSGKADLDALAVVGFSQVVGRANTYRLPVSGDDEVERVGPFGRSRGRRAFPAGTTASDLAERVARGQRFVTLPPRAATVDGDGDGDGDTLALFELAEGRPPRVVTGSSPDGAADRRRIVLAAQPDEAAAGLSGPVGGDGGEPGGRAPGDPGSGDPGSGDPGSGDPGSGGRAGKPGSGA